MNDLCNELGLDYADIRATIAWDKEKVRQEFLKEYKSGKPVHVWELQKNNASLFDAVRIYYGGIAEICEELGIDYSSIKRVDDWSAEKVKDEFLVLYDNGVDVNTVSLKKHHNKLHCSILRYYGSVGIFFESLDIEYSKVQIENDATLFAPIGRAFERVLDGLFTELEVQFTKYGSGDLTCRPDYIFSPVLWADAKLSASAETTEMRRKYLKHCKGLTVYYLIKDLKKVPTKYADGTKRVHVYKLLEDAPEQIKTKYTAIFKGLESEYYQLMSEREAV